MNIYNIASLGTYSRATLVELAHELWDERDEWKRKALDAFEAGYTQGHNDTVENCVRDYKQASDEYYAALKEVEE